MRKRRLHFLLRFHHPTPFGRAKWIDFKNQIQSVSEHLLNFVGFSSLLLEDGTKSLGKMVLEFFQEGKEWEAIRLRESLGGTNFGLCIYSFHALLNREEGSESFNPFNKDFVGKAFRPVLFNGKSISHLKWSFSAHCSGSLWIWTRSN